MRKIDKYLPYFRFYRDEDVSKEFAWWYCISDNEVYDTSTLRDNFDFSSVEEISSSGMFVKFNKVDVIELKKKYLFLTIGNKNRAKWESLSDKDFEIRFNKFIDENNLMQSWFIFEDRALRLAFSEWYAENKFVIE